MAAHGGNEIFMNKNSLPGYLFLMQTICCPFDTKKSKVILVFPPNYQNTFNVLYCLCLRMWLFIKKMKKRAKTGIKATSEVDRVK